MKIGQIDFSYSQKCFITMTCSYRFINKRQTQVAKLKLKAFHESKYHEYYEQSQKINGR
jgi:hypothetical protein